MTTWSYLLEVVWRREQKISFLIIKPLPSYFLNRAYVFFAKAANMGNLKAMEKMADALLFGNFGMQNITAAIQLYESLAKEGSYKAQNVSFEQKVNLT